jgi:hypothetical protein
MTDALAPRRAKRWSLGRLATDLAVVAVGVPIAIDWLVPPARGECGTTLLNLIWAAGLIVLGARLAWLPLKALNDASDRWLAAREAKTSTLHPTTDTTGLPSTP